MSLLRPGPGCVTVACKMTVEYYELNIIIIIDGKMILTKTKIAIKIFLSPVVNIIVFIYL